MAQPPDDALFSRIDQILNDSDAARAFDELCQYFSQEKLYPQLFDTRLMKSRWELGLPLAARLSISDVPTEFQPAYQESYVNAAREVGALYLEDGNLARAWTYLRAIGDVAPIRDALEKFPASRPEAASPELLGAVIQIALQEGVHPRKGLELVLEHQGMCRAITMFNAFPHQHERQASLDMLFAALHAEVIDGLKRAIAEVEGAAPDADSIPALIGERTWLFDNNAQHVDSSHVASLLRVSGEIRGADTLRLAVELADYGTRLGSMFQYAEDPPFERAYHDRLIYLKALLGEDVDRAVQHFEEKASGPDGAAAAAALVALFIRLERYRDAIDISRRYLGGAAHEEPPCPSLLELCEMAGEFDELSDAARREADPVSYLAARVQRRRAASKS